MRYTNLLTYLLTYLLTDGLDLTVITNDFTSITRRRSEENICHICFVCDHFDNVRCRLFGVLVNFNFIVLGKCQRTLVFVSFDWMYCILSSNYELHVFQSPTAENLVYTQFSVDFGGNLSSVGPLSSVCQLVSQLVSTFKRRQFTSHQPRDP